jgi:hypothetical protein
VVTRSSFADLDAVVESIADGVVISDRAGALSLVDAMMRQFLG